MDDLLDRLETQYAEADEDETVDDVIIDHDMEHFTDDELDMLGISEDDAQFAPEDYDDMYGGSEDGYGDESDDAESDDSDDSADAEAGQNPDAEDEASLDGPLADEEELPAKETEEGAESFTDPPTRTPMTPARPLMKPRTRNPPKPTMRRRPRTPPNRLRKRRTSDAHERHAQIHRPSHISDVPAGAARSGRRRLPGQEPGGTRRRSIRAAQRAGMQVEYTTNNSSVSSASSPSSFEASALTSNRGRSSPRPWWPPAWWPGTFRPERASSCWVPNICARKWPVRDSPW